MSINISEENSFVSTPLDESNVSSSLEDFVTERYGEEAVDLLKEFISEDTSLNIESGVGGFSYPIREMFKGVIYQDPSRVHSSLDFLIATTSLGQKIAGRQVIE